MRKEGENIIKPPPGKAAIRSTKIMISLLMSKVNVPAVAIPTWELIVDENRRQLDQLSRIVGAEGVSCQQAACH